MLVLFFNAGCSREETAPPYQFAGVGQEPGWLLQIDSVITFSYDYAQRTLTVPVPRPMPEATGAKVWHVKNDSTDLQVVVAETPCEDAMSGKPYPATVTVTLNGQVYRGCGGPPNPAAPGARP